VHVTGDEREKGVGVAAGVEAAMRWRQRRQASAHEETGGGRALSLWKPTPPKSCLLVDKGFAGPGGLIQSH
jgi:hypothetical protein